MAFFKREQPPSIKAEIAKLDKQEEKKKADEADKKARAEEEYDNSPDGRIHRRIKNAVKSVKVMEYTPEALAQAQAELEEGNKGLHDELSEEIRPGGFAIALSNSEFWHTKIAAAQEKIRQLEALRDKAE